MIEPAHNAPWPEPGDLLAGKYRIEGELGRGGMGVVYAAVNIDTEKRVALKWLSPEPGDGNNLARFRREARAAGRIHHPNVVTIFDIGEENGSIFLVMELLRGRSLAEMLEDGPMPIREAIGLLLPAMRGLAAAHKAEVVHRDLKPENLFAVQNDEGAIEQVKVLDFGVSKTLGDENLSVTRTGTVIGTPYYMSPEQLMGEREVNARSDIYSMGVVLYELLTGLPPFEGTSYNQLVVKIATEDPIPLDRALPGTPPELAAVVARALSRDPEHRFSDVGAFAEALEPFAEGQRYRATGIDWTGPIRVPTSARKLPELARGLETLIAPLSEVTEPEAMDAPSLRRWVPLGVLALLLLIGASFLVFRSEPEPPTVASTPADAPPIPPPAAEAEAEAEAPPSEEPAAPVQAIAEPIEPEENIAEAAAPEPTPRSRRRRRPRRSATMSSMHANTSGASMREHRAGSISLDDF